MVRLGRVGGCGFLGNSGSSELQITLPCEIDICNVYMYIEDVLFCLGPSQLITLLVKRLQVLKCGVITNVDLLTGFAGDYETATWSYCSFARAAPLFGSVPCLHIIFWVTAQVQYKYGKFAGLMSSHFKFTKLYICSLDTGFSVPTCIEKS